MKKMLLSIALIVLMSAGTFAAGELAVPREELLFRTVVPIISATRYEIKPSEAPASVFIVTSEDIKVFGWRTLTDVLRMVPGFYVNYDREYDRVGARGFLRPGDWGNKILLMVNGHYYNEDIFGGSYSGDTFGIDLDLVDRIEIVRGPGSALYGTQAVLAVINVITKTAENMEGAAASIRYGSNNTYKGFLSGGKQFDDKRNLLVSASQFGSDGNNPLYFPNFDAPATNNGFADNLDWEKATHFFANANYQDIQFYAAASSREKAFPTAAYSTVFNDPRARDLDNRSFLELKMEPRIGENRKGLLRLYYDNYVYRGDFPQSPVILNRDNAEGGWWGGNLQLDWDINPANKLIVGAEYENHGRVFMENFDVETGTSYLNVNLPFNLAAAYIEDTLKAGKAALTVGVRNDAYSEYGTSLNPRLGLVINPEEDTYLKFLYGRAFRAPTPFEKYYNDGVTSKANLNLMPEVINTYEIVLERGGFFDASFTGILFHYHFDNLITQKFDTVANDGKLQYQNVDKASAVGGSISMMKNFKPSGASLYLSYIYQRAIDASTSLRLSGAPANSGKMGVVLPVISPRTTLALETIYTGERITLARNITGPFILANLNLRSEFLQNYSFAFKINNIFDVNYADPASREHAMDTIPQDGRTYTVKVSCNL